MNPCPHNFYRTVWTSRSELNGLLILSINASTAPAPPPPSPSVLHRCVLDDSPVLLPAWPQTPDPCHSERSQWLSVLFKPQLWPQFPVDHFALHLCLALMGCHYHPAFMQRRPTEEAVVSACRWQEEATTAAEELHSCVIVWLYFEWTLFMAVTFLSARDKKQNKNPLELHQTFCLLSYWLSSLPLVCWDFPCQLSQFEFDSIKWFVLMWLGFILDLYFWAKSM